MAQNTNTLRALASAPDASTTSTTKRGRGRPAKVSERRRLVTLLRGDLKTWLEFQSTAEQRDMSDIVCDALDAYRARAGTSTTLRDAFAAVDDAGRRMAGLPSAKVARAAATKAAHTKKK